MSLVSDLAKAWGNKPASQRFSFREWLSNGKTPNRIPLSNEAVIILKGQKGKHETWLFPYRSKPVTQTSTKAWREAVNTAGIAPGFRWHDLRHTWASWHAQDGTPLNVLQELGGWASAEMVQRYAHLSTEHLAQWVNRRVGLRFAETTDVFTTEKKKATELVG